ncbi:hypothetical protein H5410_053371 [Solanum commersonii]|uniref:Uncharacterized protein n=1 Tax=Solanum commersonii TaxID=4109 RepID=A0A9J5X6X2_SOLCO|nr:hypothetical protein H5410_053371 [Solanum commersonii]
MAPPAFFTILAMSFLDKSLLESHNTILPLISLVLNNSQFIPFTSGNNFREKFVGWKADSPSYSAPLPKTATAPIFLSVVLAPTVRIHGAPFSTVTTRSTISCRATYKNPLLHRAIRANSYIIII